jgi:alpha-soluble NSF attachment protein
VSAAIPLQEVRALDTTHSLLVAVTALTQTITFLCKAGRFRQAADREKEISQIYLKELNDLRKACESLERAGEWYDQEDSKAYVLKWL